SRFGRQLSRRQALAGGGAALGAAVLAACGGGKKSSSGGGAADKSGLLFTPVDRTREGTKGGVLQRFYAVEPTSYDPLSSSSQFTFFHAHTAYQRFFSLKPGTFAEPATGDPEGDAASSWEYSPDGLQLTIKLRPNNKLNPRAPT